jgi:hypothetical protein
MPGEHENKDEDREPDAGEQLRQAEDDEQPIEKTSSPNPVGDDAQNGEGFEGARMRLTTLGSSRL